MNPKACVLYPERRWRYRMIGSFREKWLRAFSVNDPRSRNIPPDLEVRLFRKLQMIDDGNRHRDPRVPPSKHFEWQSAGFDSVRVNRQCRLVLW